MEQIIVWALANRIDLHFYTTEQGLGRTKIYYAVFKGPSGRSTTCIDYSPEALARRIRHDHERIFIDLHMAQMPKQEVPA
jgi:hypothetical protein